MNIGSLESHPPKARLLLWADLSYTDAETIIKTKSRAEISSILCQALHIEAPEPQRVVLLELYTNIVLFCRQQKFSKEQTSVLLSIIKNVHQLNTETPLNNMDQCFTYYSELLLCHSVRRPPFSIDLFNSDQVTEIVKYFIDTYMRHYLLYKYVFTTQMQLDLSLTYVGMPEELTAEQLETSAEAENETEDGIDGVREQETASTEVLPTETEASKQDLSSKAKLRSIVEQEVKEEVMRLTAHLEKCLKDSTDELNTTLAALETKLKLKKPKLRELCLCNYELPTNKTLTTRKGGAYSVKILPLDASPSTQTASNRNIKQVIRDPKTWRYKLGLPRFPEVPPCKFFLWGYVISLVEDTFRGI